MRIKFDPPATSEAYKAGRKRVKRKFLLFPKVINHELRWFEKAMWVQEVDYSVKIYGYGGIERNYYWKDVEWLDKYGDENGDTEWLDL